MWRPLERQWHFHAWLLVALAAVFAFVWQAPPHQPFQGVASYLPLHTALETFSLVVSFLVFGVAWNAYARERAGNLVILGCVFLAVGLIDFLHTLSYKGMPAFITPGDPEKAINFWLAARYLAAAGLVLAAVRPWRPLAHPGLRYAWLAGALTLAALVGWIGLFHQDVLPRTFIEGKGLTPLKIGAEYVLVVLFAGAAVLFFLRARRGASYDAMSLFTATLVSILSELCFTLYSDVTDVFNLLGHVYKVIAYGFIYRAVFVESVRAPFRQVQEAEARYRAVVGDLPVLLCRFLPDGTLTFVNDAYCRYFGKTRDELIGYSWVPLVPEEDREYVKGRFGSLSRDNPVVAYEHRVVVPGGEVRWQRWLDRAVFDGERLVEYQSIGEDITERRRAEAALRETEERYRRIFAGARDGIVLIDAETGFVTDGNPEFERQCDRPLAQLKGMRIWELRPPDMREAARRKFEEVRATGSGGSAELGLQRPDGTVVPVEFVATRIRIGGREFLQSICRDITERKRAAQELRRTHELLERMFESIHVLVAYLDRDFNFIRVNRAYAEADGRTPEFFPGKNHFMLYPSAENEAIFRRVVETGEPYVAISKPFEYAEHPERGVSYWDWRVAPVRDTDGRVDGLIFSLLDVTERVLAERRLRAGLERTVEAIAATIEMRDPYTAGHERRVVELATAIAREVGLAEERIEGLRFAALVHDIGKIRIPAEILSKPAALSPIEFEMIKTHCQTGHDILKGIEFPWPVARMVLEHHERLDGSGYPGGLKGVQTLLESKILTVADVVEAMSSHRPYRPALGIDIALAHLTEKRGLWYDPAAADACVRLFREKNFRFG
ncbi:MAG: PAS domain S-box protein [Gammaproteobacteria bacterium]|nr:MAG: PAS domain S-box protein [Gammaproteobacteria bacterium]